MRYFHVVRCTRHVSAAFVLLALIPLTCTLQQNSTACFASNRNTADMSAFRSFDLARSTNKGLCHSVNPMAKPKKKEKSHIRKSGLADWSENL